MTYSRLNVLTQSSFATWETCPQQFYLRFVANVQPQFSGAEARRGTFIHEMLAAYASGDPRYVNWPLSRDLWLSKASDEDKDELALLCDAIEERYGNPPVLFPESATNVQAEREFALGPEGLLTDELDPHPAFAGTIDLLYREPETCSACGGRGRWDDTDEDTGIPLLHECGFCNGGGITGHTVVVRDYKTGRNIPYKEDLTADRQLLIYGYAATLIYPDVKYVRLEKHYIRFPYGLRMVEMPRERFAGVWNKIVEWSRPIFLAIAACVPGSGDDEALLYWFPTRPGTLCAWCAVRVHCPAWKNLPAIPDSLGELSDPKRIAELAWSVKLVESRLKQAKDALRSYVEENGPVAVNGEILDIRPWTESEINIPEAVRILREHGVSSDAILSAMKMSRESLNSLCKGRTSEAKALREDIKAAIVTNQTTRFGWEKE